MKPFHNRPNSDLIMNDKTRESDLSEESEIVMLLAKLDFFHEDISNLASELAWKANSDARWSSTGTLFEVTVVHTSDLIN